MMSPTHTLSLSPPSPPLLHSHSSKPPAPPPQPAPPLHSHTSTKPPLYKQAKIPPHIYKHPTSLLLELCTTPKELYQILPHIYKNSLYTQHLFQTKLISLFSTYNCMDNALRVFEQIDDKIDVLYHSMLKGYVQNGFFDDGFEFFCKMRRDSVELSVYNFVYMLRLCGEKGDVKKGREIHGQVLVDGFSSNFYVSTGLMNMYAKCGELGDAYKVFGRMLVGERDVGCWNAIISGYAQNGYAKIALELVVRMHEEGGRRADYITAIAALPAAADMRSLVLGKTIHGYVLRMGLDCYVNVLTALVDMYGKCRDVRTARLVFDSMRSRTVVTWNCIIDCYVQSGDPQEALALFERMLGEGIKPSDVTFMEVLHACGDLGDLEKGMAIHKMSDRMGLGSSVSVTNSLISMYCKCKRVDMAEKLFSGLKCKTRVSWNAMILGFAQDGRVNEALNYFREMRLKDVLIDSYTLVSVIPALAELSILRRAKWMHGVVIRCCLDNNVFVMTALIDMYAKCGAIVTARKLFDKMDERHVITWNAMIDAYGTHGFGAKAVSLFSEMQKGSVQPDEVTFLNIISACSHSGLTSKGRYYFKLMQEKYNLEPRLDHYGAMVDLLGRAGLLSEAWDFIEKMPVKPSISVYGAMLGACKIHKEMKLAEKAANRLFELGPKDGGYHVLLANIYAASSMWDKVAEVRSKMESEGIRKTPGCSFLELRNELHTFYSGSTVHPQSKQIYAYLGSLIQKIKSAGYVPDTNPIHDVEADVQEKVLNGHSEKLAIAFGLLNTKSGEPIHIRKNLRVCGDCHTASKYISLVTGREIIVRDMQRFHHFKNGSCSCGDYW